MYFKQRQCLGMNLTAICVNTIPSNYIVTHYTTAFLSLAHFYYSCNTAKIG